MPAKYKQKIMATGGDRMTPDMKPMDNKTLKGAIRRGSRPKQDKKQMRNP